MIQLFKNHTLFLIILLACILLRFIPLFEYQFTLDELSGLNRTQFNNFDDLIELGVKTTDTHPALIQLFIFAIAKLFGYANWIIKLPFLLMSIGTIIYAYIFCFKNFSKQVAIISTLIFSFSLIFVFYAPIARMYVAGTFFSMALLYYFFELFFSKKLNVRNLFWFGLFALLSALNQHLNALFAFTICFSGLLFLNKSNFKSILITYGLIVLFYLPHLPVTLYQLNVGGIGYEQDGWLEAPKFSVLFYFIKILLGTGKSYFVFISLISLSFIKNKFNFFEVLNRKKQYYLLFVFLINFLIIFFYSLWRAPVYQNSVMLFSATAFVIFISSLFNFKNNFIFYFAVFLISTTLIYKTYFKKEYFKQVVKTVFEYQFERSTFYKNKYGNDNVYSVFFDADTFMKKIYFNKYNTCFNCKIFGDSVTRNIKNYMQFISNLKSNYLVLSSAIPSQQAIAKQYFPYLIENTVTQGINFKVYSKKIEDKKNEVPDDEILENSTLKQKNKFKYSFAQNNNFPIKIDSTIEFPFEAHSFYNELISHEGQVLQVTARFKNNGMRKLTTQVCISINDLITNETYFYTAVSANDFIYQSDSTLTIYLNSFMGTKHNLIKDKSKITCYLWNREKDNFQILDFKIELINFWKEKWQFWD